MIELSAYQLQKVIELQKAQVDFIVIGGRAIQAYGLDRETCDLDILVSRNLENANKLFRFLSEGFPNLNPALSAEMFSQPQKQIPIPSPEDKEIDILTSLGALDFDISFKNSIVVSYKNIVIPVIGLSELIYSKMVSASSSNCPIAVKRDLDDLKGLSPLFHKQFPNN